MNMRMTFARVAVVMAMALYVGVIGWLMFSEIPVRMMSAALLALTPLVIAGQQELKEAAEDRKRIADEIRRLREEVSRVSHEVL